MDNMVYIDSDFDFDELNVSTVSRADGLKAKFANSLSCGT